MLQSLHRLMRYLVKPGMMCPVQATGGMVCGAQGLMWRSGAKVVKKWWLMASVLMMMVVL